MLRFGNTRELDDIGRGRKRLEENGTQQRALEHVFAGGEARSGFLGLTQAGKVNQNGVDGALDAQAARRLNAGLAKGAGETKDSGEAEKSLLGFFGKRGEGLLFGIGWRAALVADNGGEKVPLGEGPSRRDVHVAKEGASGLVGGFGFEGAADAE